MSTGGSSDGEANTPVFELHFSPRELVKSVLRIPGEDPCECGVKGREVRWQQGAIAVCILVVYTRLRALEGAADAPVLEGEQGSPARSIDNLLNKPGEWALHMFGEFRGMPRIRNFIYRKRTVSRSNPTSAVQWDEEELPAADIRIWQAETELDDPESLRALLRTLLEEFNPRRAAREWERLFPPVENVDGSSASSAAVPASAHQADGERHTSRPAARLWVAALALVALGLVIGRWSSDSVAADPASAGASVVTSFIDALNADDLEAAYRMTSPRFQESVSPEAFHIAFGDQRYNFPRLAGNPYRNTAESNTHDFRVTLYVESRVHRIPPLGGLSRVPLTRIEDYANRLSQVTQELAAAGVDAGLLNQLSKERLERRDASRHIQLVCGLSDEQIAAIYPEEISTTLDLTLFFELVRTPQDDRWLIQSIEDSTERLVAF